MNKIAKLCAPKYTIIKKIQSNVFIVENEYHKKLILKILKESDHHFFEYGGKDLLQRSANMAKLFSDLGMGPKLIDHFICMGVYLVMITDYIENPLRKIDLNDKDIVDVIRKKIKKLHDLGIIHGDLHGANIRLRGNEVYFIDTDTAFTIKEFNDSKVLQNWIKEGFDIDELEDYIDYEENENYENIPGA